MINTHTKWLKILSLIYAAVFFSLGCTEKSETEKLRDYLASINAAAGISATSATPGAGVGGLQATLPPLGTPTITPGTAIIGGTPRQVKDGFCGDGIINGPNEDCDMGAIQNVNCSDYNGIAGTVKCQPNCLYDIGDCITPAVDKQIGGVAETCDCQCNSSFCKGGCMSTSAVGQSVCRFLCDDGCDCLCEGKLESKVEQCEFRCACTVDTSGNPQCQCNLDDCQLLVGITPNIATVATSRTRIRTGR